MQVYYETKDPYICKNHNSQWYEINKNSNAYIITHNRWSSLVPFNTTTDHCAFKSVFRPTKKWHYCPKQSQHTRNNYGHDGKNVSEGLISYWFIDCHVSKFIKRFTQFKYTNK
jgi:hypothetical protein